MRTSLYHLAARAHGSTLHLQRGVSTVRFCCRTTATFLWWQERLHRDVATSASMYGACHCFFGIVHTALCVHGNRRAQQYLVLMPIHLLDWHGIVHFLFFTTTPGYLHHARTFMPLSWLTLYWIFQCRVQCIALEKLTMSELLPERSFMAFTNGSKKQIIFFFKAVNWQTS